MSQSASIVSMSLSFVFGLGVLWHVWSSYGFWWGLIYGAFWQIWLGYRVAAWLLP